MCCAKTLGPVRAQGRRPSFGPPALPPLGAMRMISIESGLKRNQMGTGSHEKYSFPFCF